eukprot:3772262-Pleurochrysis_carterae.AAC.1
MAPQRAEGRSAARATHKIEVASVDDYLHGADSDTLQESSRAACEVVARSLLATGMVILRDSRVKTADHEAFLDMLELYFDQDDAAKKLDERPDLHYQVGTTPELTEVPVCKTSPDCARLIQELPPGNEPAPIAGADPKWRFFWRIGDRPTGSQYEDLNAEPVTPAGFPSWSETMDRWGSHMLQAVRLLVMPGACCSQLGPSSAMDPYLLAVC